VTLPDVIITTGESPPSASADQDTATLFATGLALKGSTIEPVEIRNEAQIIDKLGDRQSWNTATYDALETFFREGGYKAYFQRIVGPAAVTATANLFDAAGSSAPADVALAVTASSPGEWGNSLNVEVDNQAGVVTLIVTHDTDGEVDRSPALTTRDELVAWASTSDFIRLVLGASAEMPRDAAAASLAAGADDRASVTEAHWTAALTLFTKDMGPGQVAAPGRTTTAAHTALLAHAAGNNRFALLDLADTATEGTLISETATHRPTDNARFGAAFAPWVTIPGVVLGTTRTAPPSGMIAGIIARNEAEGMSPNRAAAGDYGVSRFAIGLSQIPWTEGIGGERELLNDAGVNVIIKRRDGTVRNFGYRTMVNPVTKPGFLQASAARLFMAIASDCLPIAGAVQFDEIDPKGERLSRFKGEIIGVLLSYGKSIYGYAVQTDESVNPPEEVEAGRVKAVLALQVSPFAEVITLEIVKVANTEVLA
jgi:hypothetical protein